MAWRIYFVLKSFQSNNEPIYPTFVQHITEKLLETQFSVTGINKKQYMLYEKIYSEYNVFRKSLAFSLVFTEAVFEIDWTHIEAKIKLDWCSHFSKNICYFLLCFSTL